MENLTQDQQELLTSAGISFMQAVTEIYGPERGMELWSTIADTIDPALKGEIFILMLTGRYAMDRIHVRHTLGNTGNKVALIKCIRTYDRRNLSLKEAKDIADEIDAGVTKVLEVAPQIRPTFVTELRKLGMAV